MFNGNRLRLGVLVRRTQLAIAIELQAPPLGSAGRQWELATRCLADMQLGQPP